MSEEILHVAFIGKSKLLKTYTLLKLANIQYSEDLFPSKAITYYPLEWEYNESLIKYNAYDIPGMEKYQGSVSVYLLSLDVVVLFGSCVNNLLKYCNNATYLILYKAPQNVSNLNFHGSVFIANTQEELVNHLRDIYLLEVKNSPATESMIESKVLRKKTKKCFPCMS